MYIPLDIGNGNIKGMYKDNKFLMPATLESGVTKLDDSIVNVEYKGKPYSMGKFSGDKRRDYGKYSTDFHEVMLLTSIVLTLNTTATNIELDGLIVGLPISYFLNHGVDYRKLVLDMAKEGPIEITVKGIKRTIAIKDCVVLPQSAIPFKEEDTDESSLVIDIGSGTTDVSYWDGRTLVRAESYHKGCADLYVDIAADINKKNTEYNIEPFLIERNMIKNPKLEKIKILGEEIRIKDSIDTAITSFVNSIISKISRDFSNLTLIDNLYIAGGGALFTEEEFKKTYKFAKVDSNVFFNVEIYDIIGGNMYGSN